MKLINTNKVYYDNDFEKWYFEDDEDFDKIAKNQSDSSLYHLAGDSIVTTCLGAIFGSLFSIDWTEKFSKLGIIKK